MLSVSGISIHFAGRYLFDNVSFVVKPKDRIGLIGKNGQGKSTLLRIIAGVQGSEKGSVSFPTGYKLGYLPQEVDTKSAKSVFEEASSALEELKNLQDKIDDITVQLGTRTDYETDDYMNLINELTDANERYDILGGAASESTVERVLIGLGFIREEFDKKCSEFSGGWQMRIELAKILLQNPDLILLDEPTNHLDIESIIWLEDFLKNYFGSIMIVSHDRRFLDNITNKTIEISRGKIYEGAFPYTKFLESREEQRDLQIAAKKNQDRIIAQQERFIERFKAKATFASRAQSKQKQLDKIERIEVDDVDASQIKFRFPEPPRSGRLVAEAKALTKSFGPKTVLKEIDFALERGEKAAFVGKNGEGKSTLSKIIAGIESHEGELVIGHNVKIGYFAQHQAQILDEEATPFEILDRVATGEMRTKVRDLLGAFLFSGDDVHKKVKVLSGGERSRLSLAKLLLDPYNLLIMDEPTNHLDIVSKEVLKNALADFEGSIIIVSHDRDFLEGLTNKTVSFKGGKIKEYPGDIREFLENQDIQALVELELNKKAGKESQENMGEAQVQRLGIKEFNREKGRLEKLISADEAEVADLEIKTAEYEKKFADPSFFSDQEKAATATKEFEDLKHLLKFKLDEWTKNQEELDKLIKDNQGL